MSLPHLILALRLGDLNPPSYQRLYFHHQIYSLEHDTSFSFNYKSTSIPKDEVLVAEKPLAHQSGTSCLTIDQNQGRYLVSGGSDTAVRLWDLDAPHFYHDNEDRLHTQYSPVASLSKANPASHTHAITSVSTYPHDPVPTTLLSTSFDTTLLVTSLSPSSLTPIHRFALDHAVYTHALSPIPSGVTSTLIAAGTAHPSVRLLDLRSGLSTHSLAGHQGEIWSLAWHPRRDHTLLSAGTDGRILAFDIRRASPAFASFDVDDTLGIVADPSRPHLNYTHRAHSAPITGLTFTTHGTHLLSASHDQRLRLWDTTNGANALVHFGARIRNSRHGNLTPLLAPPAVASGAGTKRADELIFWPNDDPRARGEIFVCTVREGHTVRVMKTQGLTSSAVPRTASSGTGQSVKAAARASLQAASRITAAGRINALAFRTVNGDSGTGVELYAGQGDGGINVWKCGDGEGGEIKNEDEKEQDIHGGTGDGAGEDDDDEDDEEMRRKRKRKRDLLGDLVEGLTKRPVTFM